MFYSEWKTIVVYQKVIVRSEELAITVMNKFGLKEDNCELWGCIVNMIWALRIYCKYDIGLFYYYEVVYDNCLLVV